MLQISSEKNVEATDNTSRYRWMIFVITSLGVFMATLDSSIVQITLPSIAHDFHQSLNGTIEWVSIGYLLMNAALLLPCGRFADRIGQKTLFMAGIGVFTIASALCSIAPTLDVLITTRVLQGLGGAMMLSVSMAILSNTFSDTKGRALGFNTLVVGLGTSAGPALGSIIATVANWHWIFAMNIPIGLGAFGLWLACHGHQPQPSRTSRPSQGHVDVLGSLLLAFGLTCIILALSFGQQVGWISFPILTCVVIGLALLCILPLVEQHISHPLLDLKLCRNHVFLCSTVSLMLCYSALIAVSFLLPFYCVQSRGDSSLLAGTVLVTFPLSLAAVSPLSGMLADRIGTQWLPTLGLSIVAIGLYSISFLSARSPLVSLVSTLVVTGIGQALFLSPNNASLMGSVREDQRGSASGFLATGRTLGQSLGISLSGAIFTQLGGSNAGRLLETAHQTGRQFVQLQTTFFLAFHEAFLVCACLAGAGVIMTCLKNRPILSLQHSS